jgi:hypothetical protein
VKSLLRVLLLSLLPFGALRAADAFALHDGEKFVYRVGWGIFFAAGQITINSADVHGPTGTVTKVDITTETRGLVRGVFPFTATGESLYDPLSGHLLSSSASSKTREKQTKTSISLDYTNRIATYLDDLNPARSKKVDFPSEGSPYDLILGLIQTRVWTMKPGETRDIVALFEDQFYLLTVHAEGYETVTTPMGTYNTLVLEPKMEKTPPKGMFKHGSGVKVWISQDDQHLPVRFAVEFKFGEGVASLLEYRPPGSATPARVADEVHPHS